MAKKKRTASKSEQDEDTETHQGADFEKTLAEVEKVVRQLESGELGLTESLKEYERGIKKIQQCHEVLEAAERKIAVLTGVDEDGTPHVEPVDTGEQSTTPPSRSKTTKKRASRKSSRPVTDVDDSEGLF